ncbi:hypothetical protein [Pseudoduganella ginsengisoli]|uniref:hypothetical protein n=1 Tax=Pseudoduganella ginsengisoli TaxID=1462440 RepID=UPI0012D421AB|nr:hypothetical protein [Pseudoduganella ginsengisoli]
MRLPSAAASRAAVYDTPTAAPSSIVKLSPESLAAARQADTEQAVLPAAARFKEVGAAMLRQLSTGAPVPATQAALPDNLDNKFTLDIVTRSGVKVDLTLASQDDGMLYQISADAELSDSERTALARLADGFQAAIDGMAAADPQIRIGALAQFDSKALQAVDFHADVKQPAGTQSLDFHADGKQRKVSIGGPAGNADVSVDTSKLASLGTKEQQTKAIGNYLKQFDQAAERGHGDKKLMAMFKDAFSDMNRTAVREEERSTGLTLPAQWPLADEDHAALTGLADFSASITQAPKWNNPLRSAEKESFSYAVSQATSIDGPRVDDRTVTQTQQAHLTAQFHTAVKKGGDVKLDVTPQSQTYEYHQIDDAADSNVELGYKDGHLFKARLSQTASRSERIQTYLMGKLQSDKTIPGQHALVRDLLASLSPYHGGDQHHADDTHEVREGRRQQALSALQERMLLLADPDELGGRDRGMV